jgi:hypothetical protein
MPVLQTELSREVSRSRAEALVMADTWDRRSKVRFPVSLPFFYRTVDRTLRCGLGRVLNISSGGVLAACRDQLDINTNLELTIEWPVRIDGGIPLHLIMVGSVVRCDMSTFAVASSQLRLRPVGRSRVAVPELEPDALKVAEDGIHIVGSSMLVHNS